MPQERHAKKAGRDRLKVLWVVLAILLALLIAASLGGYFVFRHYYGLLDHQQGNLLSSDEYLSSSDVTEEQDADDDPSLEQPSQDDLDQIEEELRQNLESMEGNSGLYDTEAFNVLLIGVDSRSNSFSGRSDSMILVSINKRTKTVTMTSILRDVYAAIPGHGSTRLNHAYAYGGTSLLTESIRANFGFQIDRCVVVNFFFVADLVDAVGGVDLDVTAAEINVMNQYINEYNRLVGNSTGTDALSAADAGTIHVNGSQALAYARVRYVGTDFARTGRQRTVIAKCLEKIKTMKLSRINALAEEFLPRVRTDLTESDCAALLLMALGLSDYNFQSMTIPMDGTYSYVNIRGMSVLRIDFAANSKAWHALVEGAD